MSDPQHTEDLGAARKAALFDMDRTLIRKDTASLYMRHQRDRGHVRKRDALRVAWWLLQYTFGVVNAERVAEQAMQGFRGRREDWLEQTMREVHDQYVRPLICDAGRRAVERHQQAGDWVAIVTGATPYAALPLAAELGIEHVICTRIEVAEGRFTGKVQQPMCYGPGKVTLTEREAQRHGVTLDGAVFYSDSITDLPLLERVETPVAVNPDSRLQRVARRRGWRIERW